MYTGALHDISAFSIQLVVRVHVVYVLDIVKKGMPNLG